MKQIPLNLALDTPPRLDGFVVGDNTLALAHIQQALAAPSLPQVPTYLWGESGSGKTHKADTASSANPRPAPSTRAHQSSRKNKHHSPNAKQKTCTQLAQRITQIDNRARQPNTASKQATLAQQRRNAHSRMFDLGCHKPHGY